MTNHVSRLAFLLVLGVASFALAGTDDARSLFDDARKLFSEERFTEAAVAFRAAYEANPSWKLLYNIGQCESAAKNYGPALEAFEAYLAMGGDDINEERRKEVETETDRLRRLVGFVTINAPEGATIHIAGMYRGTAPLPGALPVTAGIVQELRVLVGFREIEKRPLKISGMQSLTVDVVDAGPEEGASTVGPPPVAPETPPSESASEAPARPESQPTPAVKNDPPPEATATAASPVHPASRRSVLVPAGIVLLATGGAALIAGSITGGAALAIRDDLEAHCTDGECPPAWHDDNDRMRGLSVASTILLPLGGAAAVTGLVLLLVGKKKHENEQAVSVLPVSSPDGAGLVLKGRF